MPSRDAAFRLPVAAIELALDARVTGPLLFALLYYPEKISSALPNNLTSLISSPALLSTLKISLGLSILRKINNVLSQRALNNWKASAKFIKSQEVVLITGGASGIGEGMARLFAEKGVKVVVLDLHPPKDPLREYLCLRSICSSTVDED